MTLTTTKYGWTMPDPGGSPNTWGDILNGTTGKIDQQVFANAQGANPIGAVIMYAGAAAPDNWLLCDGRPFYRTDPLYTALFAVIGTYFGAPDGARFNIPNFVGKQSVGANGTVSLGAQSGAASVTLAMGNIPQHTHPITDPKHHHPITDVNHNHTASQLAHTHPDNGHIHPDNGSYQDAHDHGLTKNPVSNVVGANVAAGSGWAFTSIRADSQQPALHIGIGTGYANLQNATPLITVVQSGSNLHNTDDTATGITIGNAGAASPAAISTWSPYTQLNFIIRYQ